MLSAFSDTAVGTMGRLLLRSPSLRYPEDEEGFQLLQFARAWSVIEVPNSSAIWLDEESGMQRRDELVNPSFPTTALETQEAVPSTPTVPRYRDKIIIVDWYGDDDPSNPLNWSFQKKAVVFVIINFSACVVYMCAAIYTPSQPEIERTFNISATISSLGLALFLLGYGSGSLLFAPISEIPSIGRNWPYLISLFIFVVLAIPTALSETFEGLMILRFIQGFFGSPILSTGGASLRDISDPSMRPYVLYSWADFAFAGPSIGNIIAGYGVPQLGWRWSLWEILICTSPALILHLFLPETSEENILLRRAQRIRQATGLGYYRAKSELNAERSTWKDRFWGFLVMPWKINVLDPSVMFTSIYTGFIYAIFNSMFEFFDII
ncbi:hypothetical protein CBS76997_5687 [Aspergillus niger]|nr:hypothetical protein CBS12448_5125 [Aspergillus niger]KAI2892164.1 hypothetical protein CBS13152_4976 [Aspergillus niger]KAI2919292.1 hypothetical protein CBS147371_3655 [Aspergillus niger]KAI2927464.1 hypothetical protein CBS147320_5054 [Aspergillus niger]KAI2939558.1 hypothetical protein CBS147321_6642 [Aspergillus niger]